MSYPGRPPMVPGIPAMPPTMAMPYMQLGGKLNNCLKIWQNIILLKSLGIEKNGHSIVKTKSNCNL